MSGVSLIQRVAFGALVLAASVAVQGGIGADGHDVFDGDLAEVLSGERHAAAPMAYEDAEEAVGKVDVSRIESASVVTHVEVIAGSQKPKIVLLDPDGNVVYESDPTTNTTVLARDVIIPSVTIRETPDAVAELRVVTAGKPVQAPIELQQALTTDLDEPEGMFYREDL